MPKRRWPQKAQKAQAMKENRSDKYLLCFLCLFVANLFSASLWLPLRFPATGRQLLDDPSDALDLFFCLLFSALEIVRRRGERGVDRKRVLVRLESLFQLFHRNVHRTGLCVSLRFIALAILAGNA